VLGLKKEAKNPIPDFELNWRASLGGHVIALSWSPTGEFLAAASADGPVALLSAETGAKLRLYPGHAGGTSAIHWRPGQSSSGPLLASAGCDGLVHLWSADSSTALHSLAAGAEWVECLAWSNRGEYLSCAAGKRLRLWSFDAAAQTASLLPEYPAQPATIADLAWKPGAQVLLASCGYNGLVFWSPAATECVRKFDWKGSMLKLAWSPNGRYIATGNQDSTIQFWNVDTGKELQMWGYRSKIRELSWDAASRFLASGGSATGVVWDCSGKGPAGTKPILLDFHSQLLSQLAFQREGSLLASGCREGLVALWRPGKKDSPLATAHLGSAITQVQWSPCQRRLAVGAADGEIQVLRAGTA
jgi:WD40 repeat protein